MKFVLGSTGTCALALALLAPSAGASQPAQPTFIGHQTTARAVTDGRLVFQDYGTGQLYTSNPDGSALVQVTHLQDSRALDAHWSPDSSRILFNANPSGDMRLYTIKPDGTGRQLVTRDTQGYGDIAPAYSPDGQVIVYSRCRPDSLGGGCALYEVAADGTGRRHLTTYRRGVRAGTDYGAEVSPDGQWVAFTRFDWNGISSQIWLVQMDGTDAHSFGPVRLAARGPRWSADGNVLYFWAGPQIGLGLHVYQIALDGGGITQLTFTAFPNGDFQPDGSPTGERIAFISDRTHPDLCCQDLYTMNADGSSQLISQTGLSLPGQPDWGSAPLQNGPSVQVPPLTADQLAAGRSVESRAEQPGRFLASR